MSWLSKTIGKITGSTARKEANANAQNVATRNAAEAKAAGAEQLKGMQDLNSQLQTGFAAENQGIANSVRNMNDDIGTKYGDINSSIGQMYGGLNDKYQSAMDGFSQSTDQNIAAVDRSFDRSDSTSRARMLAMGFNPDASDVFARNEAQMATQRGLAKEDVLNRATQATYNAQMQGLGAQSQNTGSMLGMQSGNTGSMLGMQSGNTNAMNSQLSANIGNMYGQMGNNLSTGYGLQAQGNANAWQGSQNAANAAVADAADRNKNFWGNVIGGATAIGSIAAAPMTGGASLAGLGAAGKMMGGGN